MVLLLLGVVTVGLLWFDGLVTVVLPEVLPDEVVTALSAGRAPGAVRVTVDLPEAGLEVTAEPVFFEAAACLSRIAEDVLVMLLFDAAGLEVTVLPDADPVVFLFIGRLLTELPPLSGLLPANTLSEPVLCRVPV